MKRQAKKQLKRLFAGLGLEIRPRCVSLSGATHVPRKADARDYSGRFREIISDPLNLLIERHPLAGFVYNDLVYLHNGNLVPIGGPNAYCGSFSEILIVNRGVHEPLEEYVFQEVTRHIDGKPVMLELGAYWGHYSLWLKKKYPNAATHLVEPDVGNLAVGRCNFDLNKQSGEFYNEFVGDGKFTVDRFVSNKRIKKLDILHSDIQGYEIEMLRGCESSLKNRIIDYFFISTHSQDLHMQVEAYLALSGYRLEVSSDVDHQTTSSDGFVFASNPAIPPIFHNLKPLGRKEILLASPARLINL